ncbi:MAG: substrate-binding domain-containing protein [Acidimicrobiales bacterium]
MARPSRLVLSLLALVGLVCTACGSSTHGTANVGYAGSLTGIMQTSLQPAFQKATGDSIVGVGEGSTALAHSILNHELFPGAFLSIGKQAIKMLWPSRSRFVLTLATDPLVVAYSPKSRYAAQLNQIRSGSRPLKDLFALFGEPGFRLGRTNPNLDPQGATFILMVKLAERVLGLPKGTAAKVLGTSPSNPIGSSGQLYDENGLPTDIASGTVDAGSDFLTEARQFKLDYITLPPSLSFADPSLSSLYAKVALALSTGVQRGGLTTLDATLVLPPKGQSRSSGNRAADEAWLAFLLSPTGQSALKRAGYSVVRPTVGLAPGFSTARAALPAPVFAAYQHLRGALSGS